MIKRPLMVVCLLFLLLRGILLVSGVWAADLAASPLELNGKEKENVSLEGEITRREEKETYYQLYLKHNSIMLGEGSMIEPAILVCLDKEKFQITQLKIGNTIKVTGSLAYFDAPKNPGQFDQKFYYQKQKIHGQVWAKSMEVTGTQEKIIAQKLALLRQNWRALLVRQLGEENGNLVSAILLGEKGSLDSELKTLYQKNGIGHILAISGLHMSFLGIGIYQFLRKRGLGFAVSGFTGIFLLVFYTMMIGCSVSSMRAVIMYSVRMGAEITGEHYDTPTSIALSAAVIVLWRPLYLLDAGFLMSFGAILGIYVLLPVFSVLFRVDEKTTKLRKCWREGFAASCSINTMLFPILLYYYFEFPLYSFLLNLYVIPLMSVVLGAGILGSLLSVLCVVPGGWILRCCQPIMKLYEVSCQLAIHLPGSRLVIGKPEKWQVIVYYVILMILIIGFRRIRERKELGKASSFFWWKSVGIGMGICMVLLVCVRQGYDGKTSVTMLDVGQGDGICIRSPKGLVCFVDGGSSSVSLVGKYRMEPYLESQGMGTIDYAFISHGDSDHYSGIEEMLKNQDLGIRIRNLVLPMPAFWDENLTALAELAKGEDTEVLCFQSGSSLTSGGMKLTYVAPDSDYAGEIGNESSMVLHLSFQSFDMLLTGDVEGTGEEVLTREMENRKYEVLKVAHHGSKNSSSEQFLKKVMPDFALISAGENNRYGHPHQETLERLTTVGSQMFSTAESGAITIKSNGKSMEISVYKK